MTDTNKEKNNINEIHEKAKRIASAIFLIIGNIESEDLLKSKIKDLSLNLVSKSVNLRNSLFSEINKTVLDMEKICIELMSFLDIASVSGLISKMNGEIIKKEFNLFVFDLNNLSQDFEKGNKFYIQNIFEDAGSDPVFKNTNLLESKNFQQFNLSENKISKLNEDNIPRHKDNHENGYKRKNLRKSAILEFIKGHNNVSIKDIVPNITGCSEKTIQRELIELIKEGKISKVGERRWSKYSIV